MKTSYYNPVINYCRLINEKQLKFAVDCRIYDL